MNPSCLGAVQIAHPGRLVSLEDMLKVYAHEYIAVGRKIQGIALILNLAEPGETGKSPWPIQDAEKTKLKGGLQELSTLCGQLDLPVAKQLVDRALNDFPASKREFEVIAEAVTAELKTKLFLFVPSDRARYYEDNVNLSQKLRTAFPAASGEIRHGGNCYAVGEYTACVFHAMRAAELGLRAVAKHIGVTLHTPLESADWHTLIEQIDKHIKTLMGQTKTQARDDEIKFFSDANSQFVNFKEAFRKHVAHARDSYEEIPSISILHRTREFLEALSNKVSE
jgi:hypothetical protein